GPTGQQFWSHATLREGTGNDPNSLQGDVRLLDDAGRMLAEALGVRCMRLGGAPAQETEKSLSESLYEIQWQPMPRSDDEIVELGREPGVWLLFSDRAGIGAKIRDLLEARGDSCVIVSAGNRFERLSSCEYEVEPASAEHFRELFKRLSEFDQKPYRGI